MQGAPDDTVQSLKWSPSPNEPLLSAGAWDGVCRIWRVNEKGEAEAKAQQQIPAPVLATDWFDVSTNSGIEEIVFDVFFLSAVKNCLEVEYTAPLC